MMSEPATRWYNSKVFKKRTISVVIGLPVIAAVIWFGTPWLTIVAAVWGLGAAAEFYRLVKRARGYAPLTGFGLIWVVLFIVSPHFMTIPLGAEGISTTGFLLVSAVILPLIILMGRRGKENAFVNWAWTIAGILYIGWLLSYMVALRTIDEGRGWVFLAILCTFASDISAYITGKAAGRHKLAPYVSPNKTWEGSIGGVAGSIILSVAVALWFGLPLPYWQAVLLGIAVSIMGQLGDLVKSLFKRNMEVKDSGNVLPGHGGFLDRMDSLAFAGVTVFYFVEFFI